LGKSGRFLAERTLEMFRDWQGMTRDVHAWAITVQPPATPGSNVNFEFRKHENLLENRAHHRHRGSPAFHLPHTPWVTGLAKQSQATPVAQMMQRNVCLAEAGEMVESLLVRLQEAHCKVLPVTQNGELVGIQGEPRRIHDDSSCPARIGSRPANPAETRRVTLGSSDVVSQDPMGKRQEVGSSRSQLRSAFHHLKTSNKRIHDEKTYCSQKYPSPVTHGTRAQGFNRRASAGR
jgi:hypothetical protein